MPKRLFLSLSAIATVLIAGCVSQPQTWEQAFKRGIPFGGFYKTGTTGAELMNTQTNCNIEASQRVPSAIRMAQTPSYTTPANTSCYGSGYGYGYGYSASTNCTTTGGQTYGGQTYSYDANANLRQQAANQCMARHGFRYISIPACPKSTTATQLKEIWGKVAPPLTANTCYVATGNTVVIGKL